MVGAVQEGIIVRELNRFEAIGYDRAVVTKPPQQPCAEESKWYEEEIDDDLKLCYRLNSVLHRGASKYQEIALIDTKHFGKALIIDGKMQSAEVDEFIYHESLVHPPLLFHPNPKTVFIMGGGEGSTAREVLRHNTVQRVVMCDIDEEVVEFCRTYLSANWAVLRQRQALPRHQRRQVCIWSCQMPCHSPLSLLMLLLTRRNMKCRAELEKSRDKFDVIVGDLADPVEGGPCYQLYTKSFYEHVVKPKLTDRGIFAGPAGVLTHREVFSSIYNTLRHVFKYVKAYTAHVPSFADTWGWVMASDHPFNLSAQQINARIKERVDGELVYLSGESLISSTTLNKSVYKSLQNETHVYTEDDARFIHGHGRALCA
ncbi:hypothetical protein EJB05_25007 [Eragrostis curvula]|uniref:thermospermine synthase n=1 Tax=Eragrostis curvula TaxID=38414 RepID=A0A5J9VCU4_9POAL|nr:hypothetical protein EJB05_25007 [Eragrostis curvula]